ncbi:HNH endonuclease [Janibacter hoylei]|uniref:HNH endonuclease n=1 Tax=Janibacter hoylei TaxID=364298 RepID=UPI00059275B2|nr:HNH endonuclease signature motif containing protein [Janibacter hoylei]
MRKLACEAGVIPVMLGSGGEPLELGRASRFFTPGQKRLLWLRDGGCTFPGCTMPAHWTDAHHVQYWSLGGRTDVGNAALLCERHHTRVHQQELACTVRDDGVTWHL